MKQFTLFALLLAIIIPACSTEQKIRNTKMLDKIITDTSVISGTVIAVDHGSRMATIKDSAGYYATFMVDREVKNLDRIQKGDQAVATYIESIGIRITGSGSASATVGMKGEITVDVGLKEGKPYRITARIVDLRAVVDTIHYQKRHVSVRGSKGNIISFKVGKNIEGLENVKKGDAVVIYYTEAIAILIEKTGQPR